MPLGPKQGHKSPHRGGHRPLRFLTVAFDADGVLAEGWIGQKSVAHFQVF